MEYVSPGGFFVIQMLQNLIAFSASLSLNAFGISARAHTTLRQDNLHAPVIDTNF